MNLSNNEIRIPLRKKKMVKTLCLALVFLLIGIFIPNFAVWAGVTKLSPIFFKIVQLIILPFSLIGVIFIGLKILSNKPGLVINDEGIWENKKLLARWGNITGVTEFELQGQKMVGIHVDNFSQLLAEAGVLKRMTMLANQKILSASESNPPQFLISAINLDITFPELVDIMAKKLEEHKAKKF